MRHSLAVAILFCMLAGVSSSGATQENTARERAQRRPRTGAAGSLPEWLQKSKPARLSLQPGVQQTLDIVYATYGSRQLKLDWFSRRGGPVRPAVIVVHGGGWKSGSRAKFHALAGELANRGYAAFAIEYRLAGEAHFPAAIHDCSAAVRFVRNHAKRFNIDPNQIVAVGGSAGGHLVGLMAAASHLPEMQGDGGNPDVPSTIQAAVVMAGPMQLATGSVAERSRLDAKSNANLWIGKTVDQAPDTYRFASPETHLSKQTCPILFQAGEYDSPGRNATTRKELHAQHVKTGIQVFRHGKHGCWNRDGWRPSMIDGMDEFFREVIAGPSDEWTMLSSESLEIRRNGRLLRIHVKTAPRDGKITIPRLTCPIGDVWLGDGQQAIEGAKLKLVPGLSEWTIALPKGVDTTNSDKPLIVSIDTKASAIVRKLPPIVTWKSTTNNEPTMHLPGYAATTSGEMLRYEPQPHKNTVGYWVREKDYAEWLVYSDQPRQVEVVVSQGCGKGQGGSSAEIVIGDQRLSWKVVETGHFQNFQNVRVGRLLLPAGVSKLQARAVKKKANAVMDIREIWLTPLASQ